MKNIDNRLSEIANLKEGWFNGEGKSYNKEELETLRKLYNKNYNSVIPAVFPAVESEIVFEWGCSSYSSGAIPKTTGATLYINIFNLKSILFYFDYDNDDNDLEFDLDLNNLNDWETLNNLINTKIKN